MAKNASSLLKVFQKKAQQLDLTRVNFEKAFALSTIHEDDIKQAYAGLYLDLFTDFEQLIENLFIGLLNKNIKHNKPEIKTRIKISPTSEVEVVLSDAKKNKYLDWLPYTEHTLPRAKIFLEDGKPFSFLTDLQKDKISKYHKIRNALAHKSKKALLEFESVIGVSALRPIEKTPQGYLRNVPNPATGKTQFEIAKEELEEISHTLCV